MAYRCTIPGGVGREVSKLAAICELPRCPRTSRRAGTGTEQEFSSSLEHLESGANKVSFIVSFPRINSKPSPSLSRSSAARGDSVPSSSFRSRAVLKRVRVPCLDLAKMSQLDGCPSSVFLAPLVPAVAGGMLNRVASEMRNVGLELAIGSSISAKSRG